MMKLTYLDYELGDLQPQIMDQLIFLKLQEFGWSQRPRSRYVALTMYEAKVDGISMMGHGPDQELVLILSVQYINSENMQPLGCLFYGRDVGVEKIAEALVRYIKDLVKCECFVTATLSNVSDKIVKVIEYMVTKSGYDRNDEYSEMVYSVANMEIVHLFDPISLIEGCRDLFWCHDVHFRMSKKEVVSKYSDFANLLKDKGTPAYFKKIFSQNDPSTPAYAIRTFSQTTFHSLLDHAIRHNEDNGGTPELIHLFDIAFDSLAGEHKSAKTNRGPISSSSPHFDNWRRIVRTIRTMYLIKNNTRFDICHRILSSKFKTDDQKVTSTLQSLVKSFMDYDNLYELPPNFIIDNFSKENCVDEIEHCEQLTVKTLQTEEYCEELVEDLTDEDLTTTISQIIDNLDIPDENCDILDCKTIFEMVDVPTQSESSDDEEMIKHIARHNELAFVPPSVKDCMETLNQFSQVEKTEWNSENVTEILSSIGKARRDVEQSLGITHFDKPVKYSPYDFESSKNNKLSPRKDALYQRNQHSNLKCNQPNLKGNISDSNQQVVNAEMKVPGLKNDVYKSNEGNLKNKVNNSEIPKGSNAKTNVLKPKNKILHPKTDDSNSKCKNVNLKHNQQESVVITSYDDAKTNDSELETDNKESNLNLRDAINISNLRSDNRNLLHGKHDSAEDEGTTSDIYTRKLDKANLKIKKSNANASQKLSIKNKIQNENFQSKGKGQNRSNLETDNPNPKNKKSKSRRCKSVGHRDDRRNNNLQSDKTNQDIEKIVDLYNDVVDSKFSINVNHLDKSALTNLSDYVNLSNQLKERYPGQVDKLDNEQLFSRFMTEVINEDTMIEDFETLQLVDSSKDFPDKSECKKADENIANENRDVSNNEVEINKEDFVGYDGNDTGTTEAVEIEIYFDNNDKLESGKNEYVEKKFGFFYKKKSSNTWIYTSSILALFDVDFDKNHVFNGKQLLPAKPRMPEIVENVENKTEQKTVKNYRKIEISKPSTNENDENHDHNIFQKPMITHNDQKILEDITQQGTNKKINEDKTLKASQDIQKQDSLMKSKKKRNKKKKKQLQQTNDVNDIVEGNRIDKKDEINKNDINNHSLDHAKSKMADKSIQSKICKTLPKTFPEIRKPLLGHSGLEAIPAMSVNHSVSPIYWLRCLLNIMNLLCRYDTYEFALFVTAGYLKQSGLVPKHSTLVLDAINVFEIISSCTTIIVSRIITHPTSTNTMKKCTFEYLARIDRILDVAQQKIEKSNTEEMEVDVTSLDENLDKSGAVFLPDVLRDICDIPEGKLLAKLDEKFVPFGIIAWAVACNGMRRLCENLRKNRVELVSNACLNLNGTRHCVAVIQQYYNFIDDIPDSCMKSEFLFSDLVTGAFLGNGCVLLK